jgi:hypothetical protein
MHERGAAAAFTRALVSGLSHAGGPGACLRGGHIHRRRLRAIICGREFKSDKTGASPAGTFADAVASTHSARAARGIPLAFADAASPRTISGPLAHCALAYRNRARASTS